MHVFTSFFDPFLMPKSDVRGAFFDTKNALPIAKYGVIFMSHNVYYGKYRVIPKSRSGRKSVSKTASKNAQNDPSETLISRALQPIPVCFSVQKTT